MKRIFLLSLLVPTLVLAQDTTPDVPVNIPQSSTFWTMFLMVVGFPFLAKALNLLFDMFLNWRKSKGDKKAETYARLWALAGDAVAYVNAQTKMTIDEITAPGSELGAKVSAAEAAKYQAAAKAAMMAWLTTDGFKAAVAEIGIATTEAEKWLTGLIQKRFDTQKALSDIGSAPVVSVTPPVVP